MNSPFSLLDRVVWTDEEVRIHWKDRPQQSVLYKKNIEAEAGRGRAHCTACWALAILYSVDRQLLEQCSEDEFFFIITSLHNVFESPIARCGGEIFDPKKKEL